MSDDKHKNIPTLEDVVQPETSKPKQAIKSNANNKAQAAPSTKNKAKRDPSELRQADRRKKQTPVPEGKSERRVKPRRSHDQRRSAEMNELVKKIMQDMMPDLEQHLSMQLRFELQKHMPKILSEFKDKDDE